jgi:uncharacterized protein (TIGR02266 family)
MGAMASPRRPDSLDPGADASGRRIQPRVGTVLRVTYRNAGHMLVSYCTNLSRGGLFVATPTPLPRRSSLRLELRVPGLVEAMSFDAEVRWVREQDSDDGPAGMGVAFADDLEQLLGERIDHMVEAYHPVRVELVGEPRGGWTSLANLLRSLVACEVRYHPLVDASAEAWRAADLVVFDLDAHPSHGLALLGQLALGRPRPPTLALCPARQVSVRERAAAHARVLALPIERAELQAAVLEALAGVEAEVSGEG